jgi:hypothetical protein
LLVSLLVLSAATYAKHKKPEAPPPFQYLAGTENIEKGCGGKLEVLKEGFTFKCASGTFTMPFATITLMQYRPDVSQKVLDMKIPWKIPPMFPRTRENKYFAIVGSDQGKLRAIILRVDEDDMRPYFAEIELQSGKTVQEYRDFDEFN